MMLKNKKTIEEINGQKDLQNKSTKLLNLQEDRQDKERRYFRVRHDPGWP